MGSIVTSKCCIIYDISRLYARRNAQRATGIDRVDINYAIHFLNSRDHEIFFGIQGKERFSLLSTDACAPWLKLLYGQWCQNVPRHDDYDRALEIIESHARSVEKATYDPLLTSIRTPFDRRVYINTSHHGISRSEISISLFNYYARTVFYFIHDIIPITFPEYVRPSDPEIHRQRLRNIARFDPHIIVNSEHTKREISAFCHSEGLQLPRLHVIHIGVEPSFRMHSQTSASELAAPSFVAVGTIEPRKNHITLLHVW